MAQRSMLNRHLSYHYAVDEIPGRYVCTLKFEWEGRPYILEHECNNPVYGYAVLLDREADILDPPTRGKRAA